MLHWLAGKTSEGGAADPDTTGYAEPPETPAPVFAVRAFKHAIFGTPQTAAPKPRRHSNTENARPRPQPARVDRPPMTRPKSAGDAHALGKREEEPIVAPEPVASPTKGILMTPGTAAAKRKTVSFGDGVLDNEEKKPVRTGLPDDYPGKFPSPFVTAGASEDGPEERSGKGGKGRSKLTEQLEQVREESAKRKSRHRRHTSLDEEEDITKDFQEPTSEEARYWKTQYDVYRENSQREIKKLITKQKAAKSFAKDKDFQCTELADDLRQEKKRAEKLERRCNELEEQLKSMRAQMANTNAAERTAVVEGVKPEPAAAMAELASKRSYRADTARASRSTLREGATRAAQQAAVNLAENLQPSAEEPRSTSKVEEQKPAPRTEETARREPEPAKTRTKTRPDNIRTNTRDDIWNISFGSSSLVQHPFNQQQEPLKSPTAGRNATSGTGLTPLKSLNINTLPTATLTRRDSAQASPPDDWFAKEPLIRQEVLPESKRDEKREDSPILSQGLPQPSPERKQEARQRPQSPTRKPVPTQAVEDLSLPVPPSSPFQHSPVLSPPGVVADGKKASSYFDRKPVAATKPATSPTPKENAVPVTKSRPVLSENVKPTAAWNAINAPEAGKRVTSLTARSGREVNNDRIEAAKARMAARGRVLS